MASKGDNEDIFEGQVNEDVSLKDYAGKPFFSFFVHEFDKFSLTGFELGFQG